MMSDVSKQAGKEPVLRRLQGGGDFILTKLPHGDGGESVICPATESSTDHETV